MALLEAHFPAEREVEAQERVANIHKDGVHPCGRGVEKRQVIEQDLYNLKDFSLLSIIAEWLKLCAKSKGFIAGMLSKKLSKWTNQFKLFSGSLANNAKKLLEEKSEDHKSKT